jgi:hypothetical protein
MDGVGCGIKRLSRMVRSPTNRSVMCAEPETSACATHCPKVCARTCLSGTAPPPASCSLKQHRHPPIAAAAREAAKHAEHDVVLQHMLARGVPLNRENYIALNWMDEPEEWTAEHEMEVPECFRDDNSTPAMEMHKWD